MFCNHIKRFSRVCVLEKAPTGVLKTKKEEGRSLFFGFEMLYLSSTISYSRMPSLWAAATSTVWMA